MAHFLAAMAREPFRHWQLVHGASGAVIATRLHAAFDSATRRSGLLGRNEWPVGDGLVIAPCQAVHTVGMQFAIDVLCVGRDGTVVKARRGVRPWRIAGSWQAFAVIEMAAGVLEQHAPRVMPGERLTVQPAD